MTMSNKTKRKRGRAKRRENERWLVSGGQPLMLRTDGKQVGPFTEFKVEQVKLSGQVLYADPELSEVHVVYVTPRGRKSDTGYDQGVPPGDLFLKREDAEREAVVRALAPAGAYDHRFHFEAWRSKYADRLESGASGYRWKGTSYGDAEEQSATESTA